MLVSLADMKAYLGIPTLDTTYDAFLNQQLQLVSDSVEGYCGRKFELATYEQTYYLSDYSPSHTAVLLYHYPVTVVNSVLLGTEATTDFRVNYPTGTLIGEYGLFQCDTVTVNYEAGYATIPSPIQYVVYSVVEQNYNKKKNGVALSFGSDVQSISIPGVISVQFDYSLDSNQRVNAYGVLLGSFVNMIDQYRSERVIIGSGTLNYVV